MPTDQYGHPFTPEIAAGLHTYTEGDSAIQLCERPTSMLIFDLDSTYADTYPEEADVYARLLPPPVDMMHWPVAKDNIIIFSKQYGTTQRHNHPRPALVHKQFRVTDIHRHIIQDTQQFRLTITVTLIPLNYSPLGDYEQEQDGEIPVE